MIIFIIKYSFSCFRLLIDGFHTLKQAYKYVKSHICLQPQNKYFMLTIKYHLLSIS